MTQRVVLSTKTLNNVNTNQSLADFLPKEVVTFLRQRPGNEQRSRQLSSSSSISATAAVPEGLEEQELEVACLFADICNFTKLSERLAQLDTRGVEILANYLNSCFTQLVRLVTKAGGDVFKFAGDAVIVLWPVVKNRDGDCLETAIRRTVQCALDIQATLPSETFYRGLSLNMKIGIGCGKVKILHVGGEVDSDSISRKEYIALGSPLMQAFAAEACCKAGQVVLSKETYKLVRKHVTKVNLRQPLSLGNVLIENKLKSRIKLARRTRGIQAVPPAVLSYLPRSVKPFLSLDHSKKDWISELRLVTVLFINFGFQRSEIFSLTSAEGSQTLHRCFCAVQRIVFDYEGTINKFLVDDKGVTTLAVFGLPPLAHENDAARGVLASLGIGTLLHEMKLNPAIGVASGTAFCGVIGQLGGRKEYTVIGDTVNLAARLVQHAQRESLLVITDKMTQYLSKGTVDFERLPDSISVKGKAKKVDIYFPYRAHVRQVAGQEAQRHAPVVASPFPGSDRMSMQLLSVKRLEKDASHAVVENPTGKSPMYAWRLEWQEQVNRYTERRKRSLTNASADALIAVRAGSSGPASLARAKSSGETVMDVLERGNGVSVVLRGEIGLGKTRVLAQLRRSLIRNGDMVFCCAGNPFEKGTLSRPFGVWVDIVNEAIDIQLSRMDQLSSNGSDPFTLVGDAQVPVRKLPPGAPEVEDTRGPWKLEHMETRQMLGSRKMGKPEEIKRPSHWDDCEKRQWVLWSMLEVALEDLGTRGKADGESPVSDKNKSSDGGQQDWSLLNLLFGVHFPESPEIQSLSGVQLQKKTNSLFELLFRAISKAANRVVCLVDDAMYLDVDSLQVTLLLAQSAHVSLVVVLRPTDMHSFPVPRCRELCKSLECLSNVKVVDMRPLNSAQVCTLARSTLGVLNVPPEVEAALAIKSRGNPLFVLEMLRDMRDIGVLKVDAGMQSCFTNASTATPLQPKDAARCFRCQAKLSAIKRGHNCKRCGQVFCHDCAPQSQRRDVLGYDTPQRMCNDCFAACALQESIGTFSDAKKVAANILNLDIKPPVSVVKVLGTWLDHLTVSQQLMLKIASVACVARSGLRFSRQIVIQAFPIPDVPLLQVEREFEELVLLRLIRPVYNPDTASDLLQPLPEQKHPSSGVQVPGDATSPGTNPGPEPAQAVLHEDSGSLLYSTIAEEGDYLAPPSPASKAKHSTPSSRDLRLSRTSSMSTTDRKSQLLQAFEQPWQQSYEFVHYLMPELMHLRMTTVQQDDLRTRVAELQESHERELRLLFQERSADHLKHIALKSGYLSVSKHSPAAKGLVAGQWKKRWAVIQEGRLFLYGSRHDDIAKEELLLAGAKVVLHPTGTLGLGLTVDWVSKSGSMYSGPRAYLLSFPEAEHPQDDCNSWMYMLNFVIEMSDQTLADGSGFQLTSFGSSSGQVGSPGSPSKASARSRAKAGTKRLLRGLHRRRASFGFARASSKAPNQLTISSPILVTKEPVLRNKKLIRNRNRSWFGGSATDELGWPTAAVRDEDLSSMGVKMAEEQDVFEYDAAEIFKIAKEAKGVQRGAVRHHNQLDHE